MYCTQHRTFSPEHLEFLWFFLCKERTPRFSTKFSVINSAYSTGLVEKRSFPGFPQKSPQTVQNNPPAIFRGAIGSRGVFHETNTAYYDYYHSLIVSANGTAKYTSSHLQNTAPAVENRRSTLPRDRWTFFAEAFFQKKPEKEIETWNLNCLQTVLSR